MTDGRKLEGVGTTHNMPSARRPAPITTAPPARRGRTYYTGLQWILTVGSIAAVVVGANGLAQRDALAASEAAMTLAVNELVAAPSVAPITTTPARQRSSLVAVVPAMDATATRPGPVELPSLDLPPIPTVPAPQIVEPPVRSQIQQVLPARPAARSRSSR